MTLAVPNELLKHGSPILGFVALVPLYVALVEIPSSGRAALVTGLFGALQHCLTSFWLWFFQDFRFWTLGSTTIAYGIVYAVLGLYLWLFLTRCGRARPLAFAVLWTCFEYLKSIGFLGYPWGLLPYSLTDALPFLQVADLTGVYGITTVLAISNAAIAELLLGSGGSSAGQPASPLGASVRASPHPRVLSFKARAAYCGLALLLVLADLGYGLWRMSAPIRKIGQLDAIIVQQDTDPWTSGEEASVAADVLLAKSALVGAPRKPDLIIFSETSLRRPYEEFKRYFSDHPAVAPLLPFILDSGTWLMTGAPIVLDWQTNDQTNSAILIDPSGRMRASYAKVHPVPFAEAIPFMEYPAFRSFMQKVVGLESGFTMGTEFRVFELPTKAGVVKFGTPICFEDAFAEVCRSFVLKDADLLVNLTNIAWSKTESAEIQHWAAARFRAIESRRTLLRSTNAGVSCVVGPYGQVLDELPLFEAAAKFIEVPIYKDAEPTVYVSWGDWYALAALLLSAALSLILMVENAGARGIARRRITGCIA
jgi:apolipoprotein N-acyltransferase